MIVKLTNDQFDMLQSGECIITPSGKRYYHFPYWISATDNEEEYELFLKDYLPEELADVMKRIEDSWGKSTDKI